MKRRDLEKILRSLGWWFLRHGGSHDIWTNGDAEEAIPGTENSMSAWRRPSCDGLGERNSVRFRGTTCKDGRFWLAEIPLLDAMTQGRSRKEVLSMVEDLVQSLVGRPGFSARVHPLPDGDFEVSVSDVPPMIGLLLRRQRARSGLTLQQVAERLGASSRNTYARYEQGTSQPTLEKLNQLLHAVAPDQDLVLHQASN